MIIIGYVVNKIIHKNLLYNINRIKQICHMFKKLIPL